MSLACFPLAKLWLGESVHCSGVLGKWHPLPHTVWMWQQFKMVWVAGSPLHRPPTGAKHLSAASQPPSAWSAAAAAVARQHPHLEQDALLFSSQPVIVSPNNMAAALDRLSKLLHHLVILLGFLFVAVTLNCCNGWVYLYIFCVTSWRETSSMGICAVVWCWEPVSLPVGSFCA